SFEFDGFVVVDDRGDHISDVLARAGQRRAERPGGEDGDEDGNEENQGPGRVLQSHDVNAPANSIVSTVLCAWPFTVPTTTVSTGPRVRMSLRAVASVGERSSAPSMMRISGFS